MFAKKLNLQKSNLCDIIKFVNEQARILPKRFCFYGDSFMDKELYTAPHAEIVIFRGDIITASNRGPIELPDLPLNRSRLFYDTPVESVK